MLGSGASIIRISKKPVDLPSKMTGSHGSTGHQLAAHFLPGSCFCPFLEKETREKREIGSEISAPSEVPGILWVLSDY